MSDLVTKDPMNNDMTYIILYKHFMKLIFGFLRKDFTPLINITVQLIKLK